MEPPPPSLQAMVQSVDRRPKRPEPKSTWLLWVLLVAAAAAISGYVTR